MRSVTYGPGGFDPALPGGNVVEVADEPGGTTLPPATEQRLDAIEPVVTDTAETVSALLAAVALNG